MRDPLSLALAIAAPVIWGATFTLAKPAALQFPPLMMMSMAYAFVAVMTHFTVRESLQTPWRHAALIATLGVPLQGALVFWAIRQVDASTANLVLQSQVPLAVFLGWMFLGEVLTFRKVLGICIALLGVAIVIGLPQQRPPLVPVLMIVAGGFVWAVSQIMIRKYSRDSGPVILKSNAVYGLPQLLLATLLFESGQVEAVLTADWREWACFAFVAGFGYYVAYQCWFTLLKRVTTDAAMPFVLLMTPAGIVTAVLFLGERMSGVQIFGAVVLMLGLAIVSGVSFGFKRGARAT